MSEPEGIGSLRLARMTQEQQVFLASAINRMSDGEQHPYAMALNSPDNVSDFSNLRYFAVSFARECTIQAIESGQLAPEGEKLAREVLVVLTDASKR